MITATYVHEAQVAEAADVLQQGSQPARLLLLLQHASEAVIC